MSSIDEIISSLLISYNTSVLKELPTELRDALYEEAKRCLANTETADNPVRCNERKTLMHLINNHRLDNKPQSDFIKGPLSLTLHWNSNMKWMIYIFGELHDSETDCHIFPQEKSINGKIVPLKSMFIEDYIKELLPNTDSYIDFFLEEKAHIGYNPDLSSYPSPFRLEILRDSFRECISDVKSRNTNINCRLSRSHYFDIRQGNVEGQFDLVTQIIDKLTDILSDEFKKENIERFIFLFNNIINDLNFSVFIYGIAETSSDTRFFEYLQYYEIYSYKFLMKKMRRSSIYETILRFILDEIKLEALKYKEKLQDILKNLIELLKKYPVYLDKNRIPIKITFSPENVPDIIIQYVKDFRAILILINSIVPDAYLLSRVFKKFNINTDKPEKKRGFDEPQTPHNIIIYGGEDHANRYRKFLENHMECKRIEQNTFDDPILASNCINMTGITQPLFSYTPTEGFSYYKEPYEPKYPYDPKYDKPIEIDGQVKTTLASSEL